MVIKLSFRHIQSLELNLTRFLPASSISPLCKTIRSTPETFAYNRMEYLCHFKEASCWRCLCVSEVLSNMGYAFCGVLFYLIFLYTRNCFIEVKMESCELGSAVWLVNRAPCHHLSYRARACILECLLLHLMLLPPRPSLLFTTSQGLADVFVFS